MREISSIAIYCSSSNQARSTYMSDARLLGQYIAQSKYKLIYGDGSIGLMAAAADGALSCGGEVIGIIPKFMVEQGWNNPRSTHTIVTQTMHERKAKIFEMADAMVALPGGIGTFEELTECITWKQLGLHTYPIIILNTDGYYNRLIDCIDYMIEEHLMRPIHRKMFTVVSRPEEVIPAILNAEDWDPTTRRLAAI